MSEDYYVLLAGGVGAAKFIEGMANVIDQSLLKIIVNTGDDIELFGLNICPDLDIITYTLANLVDKAKGWGFIGETFNCLNMLKKHYDTGWFNAGDKDLSTHIYRTDLFNKGFTKAQITKKICENSPLAVRATKEVIWRSRDISSSEAKLALAETRFASVRELRDSKEAIKAFREKRKPVWKCR